MKVLVAFFAGMLLCLSAWGQDSGRDIPAPIIDIHMHAVSADSQGPPPVSYCAPPTVFPPADSGSTWGKTFFDMMKNPPCAHPLTSPTTDREMMDRTLAILRRRNIYSVTSGPLVEKWHKEGGDRIIPSRMLMLGSDAPSLTDLRAEFKSGHYAALGEVGIQYQGIDPSDSRFEPYLALAEELDIPVGIHMGPGPPGAPYFASKDYRARLHSPLLLEEALLRHPKARIYVMHAGWPMLDDTLALLWTHPQVYLDTAVIDYVIPRVAFHDYLRRIVEAGFGKRIMFGSDQMVWPGAIEVGIDSIEKADFLTPEQKRDILYNNAARFLRLTPEQISRQQHGE